MNYKKFLKSSNLTCYFILMYLVGCSYLSFSDSNEGAKLTTSQIAAGYIESSVTLNQEFLTRYLFISEYLKNQKLTADDYGVRLSNLQNKWDLNSHPLAKLKPKDVSINGNEGYATFRRDSADNREFPIIKVNFVWTGSSWAVSDDNFLGKGEIFDSWK